MSPFAHLPKRRTKADHEAALTSVLVMRTKPYSPADLESVARIHNRTPEYVRDRLRDLGRERLIEGERG